MKRYRVLAAAVVIEALFGFQYSWPVFGRILQNRYAFSATQTQMIFSATVMFFAVGFVAAGRIHDRLGPKFTTVSGGLCYGLGLITAGAGGASFPTLYAGAGAMIGLGIAFGYIGPLATAVKWFPRSKGIVAGVVVGAFASGAFLTAAVAKAMIGAGLTVFAVFGLLGVVASVMIAVLAFCLELPPGEKEGSGKAGVRLPAGLVKGGHFWSLVVGFFSGTFAGLAVIGSLEKIGETMGTAEVWIAMSVMVLSVGNAAGRAGWGMIFEKTGARLAVLLSLALQTASVLALAASGRFGPAFLFFAFAVGFNYGGCFVLYVSEVAHTYGAHRVGTVYSLIYLVYLLSGFSGPAAAGFSYDVFGTYMPALILAAAVPAAGASAFLLLYPREVRASAL